MLVQDRLGTRGSWVQICRARQHSNLCLGLLKPLSQSARRAFCFCASPHGRKSVSWLRSW